MVTAKVNSVNKPMERKHIAIRSYWSIGQADFTFSVGKLKKLYIRYKRELRLPNSTHVYESLFRWLDSILLKT